jgi:hypothetical protein
MVCILTQAVSCPAFGSTDDQPSLLQSVDVLQQLDYKLASSASGFFFSKHLSGGSSCSMVYVHIGSLDFVPFSPSLR